MTIQEDNVIRNKVDDLTYVSPFMFRYNDRGKRELVRLTEGMVAEEAAWEERQQKATPSRRAVKMANAIQLEWLLETGRFRSMGELARKAGVRRDTLNEYLQMLDLPLREIEQILFETVEEG